MLWCVKTLSFKVLMYVGSTLWRVRTLSFQSSPVCGPCALVCEDFEIFHKALLCACGPCTVVCEDLEFSEFPCVGSVLVLCEDFEILKFP